ncbi:helix-turn-helix domain-containing protein [Starkeya sp. ORNL1]|nr:helix-turn-helix domain-containing protein [Starkeya sp. ORNL1]
MALADYADEEHCCWPSRRMLAERSVQSPETVSRRLADLESAGMIERTPRIGPNGGRTSDMIRLLISAQKGTPPCQIDKGPPRQSDEAPLVTRDEAPLSAVTTQEPSIEPSIEETPMAPEGGGAGKADHGSESEAVPDTQLDVFIAAYDPDPAFSRSRTRSAWARLSAVERAEAIAGAPRYLDHCRSSKRRKCDPPAYLNDRRWKPFLGQPAKAEPVTRPAEDDPVKRAVQWAMCGTDRADWVFVAEGSDAWAAWQAAYRQAGFGHRFTMGRHELVRSNDGGWVQSEHKGRTFPRRYPPRADAASTDPPRGMTADDHDVLAGGI